jgi:hypothetical protein
MGESVLALGASDSAYVGIAVSFGVFLLGIGLFVRHRWAGLLFWSGTALGALLGQGYALWLTGDGSWFAQWTRGGVGAVLGMLAGGMLADWWQGRQVEPPVPAAPVPAMGRARTADVRAKHVDHYAVELDAYPTFEAEAV